MPILEGAPVIGLTGSFGSGCSFLMKVLETIELEWQGKKLKFKGFSLSDFVKKEWLVKNWNKFKEKPLESATPDECDEVLKEAKRSELQDIGNEIRQRDGYCKLAKLAIAEAKRKNGEIEEEVSLVFDSIRNTAEIKALREFPNFFLIAVDCSKEKRWGRLRERVYETHGLTQIDFEKDDKRDENEGIPYGQQIELCVDEADIILLNEDDYIDPNTRAVNLGRKIKKFIDLLSGKFRSPWPCEFFMSLAYTASLESKCYKRQVGAVITDENMNILSVGYNENLPPLKPCVEDPGYCRRDAFKWEFFEQLKEMKQVCPGCKKPLDYTPEFRCENKECNYDLNVLIADKALGRCTALHAEERALKGLKDDARGCIIYTTASPCYGCAVRILSAGIKKVVYAEAYTDAPALDLLRKEGVKIDKFEGVKARAYFRLFSTWRKEKEEEIEKEIRRSRSTSKP